MTNEPYNIEDDPDEDFYDSGNLGDGLDARQQIGGNQPAEPDEALEALELDDLMKEGRRMLLTDLIKAVKQGYATPQEKNTLRQMLKDNGMIMGDPDERPEPGRGAKPKADLPTFANPDYT